MQGVLPLLATDLGIASTDAALTVSVATLGLAVAVIPWSFAADRVGRLRVMTAAVVLATILGLILPLSPNLTVLLVLRFAEGAALGGIPAIALTYLSEEVNRVHAAVAAGTYVAGTTVGGLLGRIIAGPVGEWAGWRIGVLTVSVVAAGAAVTFVMTAPRPRGFRPHRPDGTRQDTLRWKIAANLRDPALLALYAQGFLLMGGFVAVYNYLGFHLERPPFSLPQGVISALFLAYLAGTWSSRRAGSLSVRVGRRRVLLLAIAVMAAGLLLTLIPWLPGILVGLLVMTAGFFGAHSIAAGWTPIRSSAGRAQASSLYNLFYYAGSSIFGWVAGYFFEPAGWPGLVGFVLVLLVLAALAALFPLRRAEAPLAARTRSHR